MRLTKVPFSHCEDVYDVLQTVPDVEFVLHKCVFLTYYYCYGLLSCLRLPGREQISKGGGPGGFGGPSRRLLGSARPEEATVVWTGRRGLGKVATSMEVEWGAGAVRGEGAAGVTRSTRVSGSKPLWVCGSQRGNWLQRTHDDCRFLSPPAARFPRSQTCSSAMAMGLLRVTK